MQRYIVGAISTVGVSQAKVQKFAFDYKSVLPKEQRKPTPSDFPLTYNESMLLNQTMTNSPNGNVYGPIMVGTPAQMPPNDTQTFVSSGESVTYQNFIYDTASQYTFIPTVECDTCAGGQGWYNATASSTSSVSNLTGSSWSITDTQYVDKVCLGSDEADQCIDQFYFLGVDSFSPSESVPFGDQGVLGLAPPYNLTFQGNYSFPLMLADQYDYLPIVTFVSGFTGDNSYVAFGYDEILENAIPIAVVNNEDPQLDWKLIYSESTLGLAQFECNTTETACQAVLSSAYPYIAVPEAMYNEAKEVFEENGFTCPSDSDSIEYPQYETTCLHESLSCEYVSGVLPDFTLTFQSADDDVTVKVPSSNYLFDNDAGLGCRTMITKRTDMSRSIFNKDFVLGQPFFRSVTISLNFESFTINMYTDIGQESPYTPYVNSSLSYVQPMLKIQALNESYDVYTSDLFVSNSSNPSDFSSSQGSYQSLIGYDTQANYTIVPSVKCIGCSTTWYTPNADQTYQGSTFISVQDWYGTGRLFNQTVCLSTLDQASCVKNLEMVEVTYSGKQWTDYTGILGLALPEPDQIQSSYVWQMYGQNYYYPQVTFNYSSGMTGHTLTIGDDYLSVPVQLIGQQYSSFASNWALDISTAYLNPANVSTVDTYGLLASIDIHLAVPQDTYNSFVSYLQNDKKDDDWLCFKYTFGNKDYCESQSSCESLLANSDYAPITLVMGNSELGTFEVQVTAENYLQSNPDDSICRTLVSNDVDHFTLGVPFFQSVLVSLDYQTTLVTIHEQDATTNNQVIQQKY